jgi:hypothetical protein
MRKVLENRALLDEERMKKLEEELKDARNQAEEADKEGSLQDLNIYLWNVTDNRRMALAVPKIRRKLFF